MSKLEKRKESSEGSVIEEPEVEEKELDRTQLVVIKCQLNDGSLYDVTPTSRVFKCEQCEMDFICGQCMISCHKPLHKDKISFAVPCAPIDHQCSCGLRNHKIQKGETSQLSMTLKSKSCFLSLKEFKNIAYYFKRDKQTKSIICVYCITYCHKKPESDYEAISSDSKESLQCTCDYDKFHVKASLQEKLLSFNDENLNAYQIANCFVTNFDFSCLTYKHLYPFLEKIKYRFENRSLTEEGMTPRSFDLVSDIGSIIFKAIEQFNWFVSALKLLKRVPNSYWMNQETITKYFQFDQIMKILAAPQSESKNETLISMQSFYCTVFRLMFCPRISSMEMFSPNISSLHRILLLKKPTSISDSNAKPEEIRKILSALKPIIRSAQNPIHAMNEYLKLLEYLIDLNHNDFNQAAADFQAFVSDMVDQFLRRSILLDLQQKKEELLKQEGKKAAGKEEPPNLIKRRKEAKIFKIERLVEKMIIYQNDYYFYYKIFKRKINLGKEVGRNEKEDNHLSFENVELNQLYLKILVNISPDRTKEDYDYTNLVDMLYNKQDCFIESLEQIASHEMQFDYSISALIENKDEDFLKNDGIKEDLNRIEGKVKQIEEIILESMIPTCRLNHDIVIGLLDQIYQSMVKTSKDTKNLFKYQIVFVSTQLLRRLMNLFELLNRLDKVIDPKKNPHFKQYQELLFKMLLLLCEDNTMTTVLLFNHSQHNREKFAFLSLNTIEVLEFYLKLLKILRKCRYKIDTAMYCELFQEYINKISSNPKTFTVNELMIILQTARLILTVSANKSYFIISQALLIQMGNIYQTFQYQGNKKIGNMLKDPLSSYSNEQIGILEAYISVVNKFNNDTFDLFKNKIEIEVILERLNESNTMSQNQSVALSMLISELMSFYSQYHFGSLYTREPGGLIQYSQLQIYAHKIQPFFNYLEHFDQLLHKDMTDRQLLNCFTKGICIPSTLLLWKISSFAMLDGVAKYSIYNTTCWFFIHFKKVLEMLEYLFKQSDKPENEINFLLETFFSEIITREELYQIVKGKYDEMTAKNFPCLEETNCLKIFFEVIQHMKFFIKSQELMKEKLSQDRESWKTTRIQRDVKDFSFIGKLKQVISRYNDKKEDSESENVLIELFNEKFIVNKEAKKMGSILINSISDKNLIKTFDNFNVFNMAKVPYLTIITKVFKKNPAMWKEIILSNKASSDLIFQFMNGGIRVFAQFVFADYTRIILNNSLYYSLLIESIEFLRLLCEDHNPFFQTILIQCNEYNMSISHSILDLIFNISIEITKHVRHFSMLNPISGQFFKKENYYNKLSEKLCEYQIEIIQGTRYANLLFIVENQTFIQFIDSYYEFLDYCTEGFEYATLSSMFLKFLNCFFEEFLVYKHRPLGKYINSLLVRLNPKKLANFAEKSFFKMLLPRLQKNEDIPLSIFSQNIKMKNNINYYQIAAECVDKILKNIYLEYDTLTTNPYFINSFYIFLHLAQIRDFKNDKFDSYQQILTTLESSQEEKKYSGLFYKICSFLLLNNEVMYTLDYDQKKINEIDIQADTQIDTNPQTEKYKELFSSLDFPKEVQEDFEKLISRVNGSNSIKQINRIKIYYLAQKDSVLLKETDYDLFDKEADYEDRYTKLSGVLNYYQNYSDKIDMRKHFLLEEKPFLIKLNEINYDLLEKINCALCLIPSILLILKSPGDIYDHILFYWIIFQLIFLLGIISNSVVFNCLKVTALDSNATISIRTIAGFLNDSTLFPFEWVFIWGLLGLRFDFLLSLQLFVIINISETMKTALKAITTRYDQFLSTGFLLIILLLFYSAVTLYFFTDRGDGTFYCTNYLDCFFYLLNNGLRGAGLAFENKIKSQPGYWSEFIYSWIFYFLIILIILNIVNGIIVDTFQELRENNNKNAQSRKNRCFICHLKRSAFENQSLNFDEHCKNEHNVLNYFKYLFKIWRTDPHDLNSVDFQVYNTVIAERIDFFPNRTANGIFEDKPDSDYEDDEVKLNNGIKSVFSLKQRLDEVHNSEGEKENKAEQSPKQEKKEIERQVESDKKKGDKSTEVSQKEKEDPKEKEAPQEKPTTVNQPGVKPNEPKDEQISTDRRQRRKKPTKEEDPK